MPDEYGFEQGWSRALEANARYYQALGSLTTEYLNTLLGILREVRIPASWTPAPSSFRPHSAPVQPETSTSRPTQVMVLEAEAGRQAPGFFLVENRLARRVTTSLQGSTDFANEAGRTVQPEVTFEPASVTLDPGEQMVVRVIATIDESFEPNIGYRGSISTPGLSEMRIPVIVRRRAPATSESTASASDAIPKAVRPDARRSKRRRRRSSLS